MSTDEKSIVFIDAQNVLMGWRNYCVNNGKVLSPENPNDKRIRISEKLDYKKLVEVLSADTNFLRAYFYDGVDERLDVNKKNFLTALKEQGIQTKTKVLKNRQFYCNSCKGVRKGRVQKGVDVALATDILRHAWQGSCQVCIVVSGDEDFADAINVARDKGVKVWVASFRDSFSPNLEADKKIYLDDITDKIKIIQPNAATPQKI